MLMMMSTIWVFVSLVLAAASNYAVSATGGVFHVQQKFAGQEHSLPALKDHDLRRHKRLLYSIDLPLGGDRKIHETGLYYTKLEIGSPPKDYYLLVDTASDTSHVNCVECFQCPEKSDLGVELTLYDPSTSHTSRVIECDEALCNSIVDSNGSSDGCVPGDHCFYEWHHGDGRSALGGYLVSDTVQYSRVTGNLQTTPSSSSFVFGCSDSVWGRFQELDEAVDGILGFGKSVGSFFSQIAASESMANMFAHCVDGKNGGGIFAMGNIVQINVTTTPLLPNWKHNYAINLEGILIDESRLALPKGVLGNETGMDALVDNAMIFAYFPEEIYTPLVNKIMENHGDLTVSTVGDTFQCFQYKSSLDANFPTVTLNFEGSTQLLVYPHDYLIPYNDEYCIGWQNSKTISDNLADIVTLGGMVFANKLVVYNIDEMNIGWREYNCSSTIKVQDEKSKKIYDVQAHKLSFTQKHSSTPTDRTPPTTDDSPTPNQSRHNEDMGRLTFWLLLCTIYITCMYGAH